MRRGDGGAYRAQRGRRCCRDRWRRGCCKGCADVAGGITRHEDQLFREYLMGFYRAISDVHHLHDSFVNNRVTLFTQLSHCLTLFTSLSTRDWVLRIPFGNWGVLRGCFV